MNDDKKNISGENKPEAGKLTEQPAGQDNGLSSQPIAVAQQTTVPSEEVSQAESADNQIEQKESSEEKNKKEEDQRECLPVNKYGEIKPGMTVRVHQIIKDLNAKGEERERIQVFEGVVISRKHGKTDRASITVRKISGGVGVEKIFPLDMPSITKIEITKKIKNVRRAKLWFLRNFFKKVKEEKIGKTLK